MNCIASKLLDRMEDLGISKVELEYITKDYIIQITLTIGYEILADTIVIVSPEVEPTNIIFRPEKRQYTYVELQQIISKLDKIAKLVEECKAETQQQPQP